MPMDALRNSKSIFFFPKSDFGLHNTSENKKSKTKKLVTTKLKYWLDDFFNGGKDEYSQNSVILTNCSRILRSESTNFF